MIVRGRRVLIRVNEDGVVDVGVEKKLRFGVFAVASLGRRTKVKVKVNRLK